MKKFPYFWASTKSLGSDGVADRPSAGLDYNFGCRFYGYNL